MRRNQVSVASTLPEVHIERLRVQVPIGLNHRERELFFEMELATKTNTPCAALAFDYHLLTSAVDTVSPFLSAGKPSAVEELWLLVWTQQHIVKTYQQAFIDAGLKLTTLGVTGVGETQTLNLLPWRQQKRRRRLQWMVGGSVGFLLIMMLAGGYVSTVGTRFSEPIAPPLRHVVKPVNRIVQAPVNTQMQYLLLIKRSREQWKALFEEVDRRIGAWEIVQTMPTTPGVMELPLSWWETWMKRGQALDLAVEIAGTRLPGQSSLMQSGEQPKGPLQQPVRKMVRLQAPISLRVEGQDISTLHQVLQSLYRQDVILVPTLLKLSMTEQGRWLLHVVSQQNVRVPVAHCGLSHRWRSSHDSLNALKLLGSLQHGMDRWGWVSASHHRLVRVGIGDRIGQERGCVSALGERFLQVMVKQADQMRWMYYPISE